MKLFESITIRNLLSFGPENPTLPLENLNVLIGPNGSGKSNLLEAIALLRSTRYEINSPLELKSVIARGGGIREWIWKGRPLDTGTVETILDNPSGQQPLRHLLALRQENQQLQITDERIENSLPNEGEEDTYFYYRSQGGNPVVNRAGGESRTIQAAKHGREQTALSFLRDPIAYPELSYLAEKYERLRLYREWNFGNRNSPFRMPQQPDLPNEQLKEDFTNLVMFLNRIRRSPQTKKALLSAFINLYEGLTDFDVSIEGGTVQVFFNEGEFVIPATRLSEGSVRFLCLLAILCDPDPPPFIGIEEPEIGLHPDILPKVADLLIEASTRTQLVVTTHSDVLVDALSDHPGAVVVCEKHDGQTTMKRLDPRELAPWLEKYRLGQLWSKGELGGNRW